MKERAYAKINMCLDVAGIRPDGYHDLKMIMVPIDFYDLLEMNPADTTTLTLNRSYLPVNDKNTIIKAIRVLQGMYGFDQEFSCILKKQIPTRAGLAGGSADAAAAIRMIDRMMDLHMTDEEKIAAAKKVGSDVPFCIFNRPCFVQGTGDILEPFEVNTPMEILLVKPRRGISTREAFEEIDRMDCIHPDCAVMRQALTDNDYDTVVKSLGNSLEAASLRMVQDIRCIKQTLLEKGFDGALMSGSGSTVFGITRDRDLLYSVMREMRDRHYFVRYTRIYKGETR